MNYIQQFIVDFKCPHCYSPLAIADMIIHSYSRKDLFCECRKSRHIQYSNQDILIVVYDHFVIKICGDDDDYAFLVADTSDPKGIKTVIDLQNQIPDIFKKTIPNAIQFLETLITFQ